MAPGARYISTTLTRARMHLPDITSSTIISRSAGWLGLLSRHPALSSALSPLQAVASRVYQKARIPYVPFIESGSPCIGLDMVPQRAVPTGEGDLQSQACVRAKGERDPPDPASLWACTIMETTTIPTTPTLAARFPSPRRHYTSRILDGLARSRRRIFHALTSKATTYCRLIRLLQQVKGRHHAPFPFIKASV